MSSRSEKEGHAVKKQLRSGTVNAGYEFEELVPAYFALKLLLDKNVKSFSIELNPSSYGKFDDVVITVKSHSTTEQFAIQLKHRVDERKVVDATNEFYRTDSKNKGKSFNISEYKKAYNKEPGQIKENYKFILFTNAIFENLEKISDCQSVSKPFRSQFLNVQNILQFKERKKHSTTKFYDNFFLIYGQENVDEMQDAIEQILTNKFNAEPQVVTSYINFFKQVHNAKYNDTKITRDVIILNLTRLLFSNCTIIPSISINHSSNIEIIEEVIKMFDLVILSDVDKSFIKKYWKCICSEEEIGRLNHLAREIKFLRKAKSLNNKQRIQLVSYLLKKPLFIECSSESKQKIYFICSLLKTLENYKIKLTLVGNKIDEDEFKEWNIFRSLKDLAAVNEALYEKFTHVFNISLQGRESASINKLKNSLCLDHIIRPSEIFYFLKGTLFIGRTINALPKNYIPRNLLRTEIPLEALSSICAKSTTVIYCNGKSTEINERLKNNKFEIPIINITNNKISDLQSKTPVLILTDESQIEDHQKQFYHLKLQQNVLQWIDNEVDPKIPSTFENAKSLVYGESGIGKTTMMTNLAHNCPLNYWIVTVPLHQQSSHFKKNLSTEKIIKQFLIPTEVNKLDVRVTNELLERKKIIFFFDGFNELSSKYMNEAVTIINNIAEQGFKVWISCTKDFKNMIQSVLGIVFCFSIEDVTKEGQEKYICHRLKDANVDETIITNVTQKLLTSDVAKNNGIFKLPLVLYILTEIFSSCKDISKLEELFTLDKMYASFVEGKLQHNLKKIGCNHLEKLTVVTNAFKNYYFNGYKTAALQTCLDPELFNLLNVKIDKMFFHEIIKNGDYLEFINVNEDNTITFSHYTFAEYFAALWLSENIDEIPFEVKKSILKPRYDGIRRFFDAFLAENCPLHLAIIEQDMSKVEKHIQRIDDVDKAGRTPLHLAVTLGKKHPLLTPSETEFDKIWERDCKQQEEILKYLLNKIPLEMLDRPDNKFLKWNSWEYADAALCLFSLAELSKKGQLQWDYLKTHYQNLFTLSYYCVKMGYKNLLKTAIDEKTLSSLENEHPERPLLHLALENNQIEIAELLIYHGTDIKKLDNMDRTPLQEAVIWGHTNFVELLLERNVDIDEKDYLGRTALHIAAKRGYEDILQILIKAKATIDSTDNEQKTPLHRAAREGRTEIVQYLVEKNADIDAPAEDASTPLHQAAEMGHCETVKALVELGADKEVFNRAKQTPLIYAAQEGHEDVVNYLIGKGANIFAKDDDGKTAKQLAELKGHMDVATILRDAEVSKERASPHSQQNELHRAVESEELETLKQLIDSGRNVEETNENKETLLHVAASCGYLSIVKYLLTKKANTAATNCDNRVPLHLASQSGHVEIVKELIKAGQISAVDRWKLTSLHRAALKGRKEVVQVLVEEGADINARNSEGGTPLHSAARGGHIDVLTYLISQGIDIKAKNNKSRTCLHVAVQRGCTDAVEYLINQNRELVSDIDYNGRTALHFAVAKGYKNMVGILIENGSDVNKENFDKQTPLDIAIKENREEIVKLLKSKS